MCVEKGKSSMFEKPVKEPISHESSCSILSNLRNIYIKPGSCVLVAEDDIVLRSLFSDALREKGLHVFSASNGLEALELYRENADKIRLVITDVMMPGMDGLTAAIEMRKIDENVFFLFMSGYDLQEIEEAGLNIENVPDSNFYQKPFVFRDIIDGIRIVDHSPGSERNRVKRDGTRGAREKSRGAMSGPS